MKFCGEITYDRGYNEKGEAETDFWIHSDICFECDPELEDSPLTEDHRKFLHDCLDEWLNKSNGTGIFWVGNPEAIDI